MMSTVGLGLISELGRRGQLGMYFDYGGYRKLRKVHSLPELASFVKKQGFECPAKPGNILAVADALGRYANDLNGQAMARAWIFSDPTGLLGLLCFPIWLLSRVFRNR